MLYCVLEKFQKKCSRFRLGPTAGRPVLGGAAFSRANDEPRRGSMSVAPDCPKGYRGKTAKKVLNPRGVPCSFLSHWLRQGTWNPYGVHDVSCFSPPVAASPQPGATNRQPLRGCKNEAQKQGGFQRWSETSQPSREREAKLLSIAVDCNRLQSILWEVRLSAAPSNVIFGDRMSHPPFLRPHHS